jgi:hypothetical protein
MTSRPRLASARSVDDVIRLPKKIAQASASVIG